MKYPVSIALISFFSLLLAVSCGQPERQVVYYINSYHEGYPPSDEAMRAISDAFPEESYGLQIRFMDSKRNPSQDWLTLAADSFMIEINTLKPNAVILSDDDAVKYLRDYMVEKRELPFVFCGVNWSADQYNLPRENITGMLEVLPLKQAIEDLLKGYPESKRIAILSENSLSEQNNTTLLDTLYRNSGLEPEYHLVDDFETWKECFLALQTSADIIYIPTNGAIAGWDNAEAKAFVNKHSVKPSFTCDDFMMPFVVYGLTKIPYEQGKWAALAVKDILEGKSPKAIPYTPNIQTERWLNDELALKIGFVSNTNDKQ